jgi:hypothetical protein
MRLALVIMAFLAASCQADDRTGDIHVAEHDQLSFEVPSSYRLTRQRDAWLLVGEDTRAGSSIAIRSVVRDQTPERSDPDLLRAATETALHAYPSASVKGPIALDDAPYPGFAFDVTFRPRGQNGDRFRRRHTTLIGSHRVFHVIETWPATRSETARRDYERVLRSVREEG